MQRIITFLSDFGDDFAKGQVQLVIKSINSGAKFVTISNQVKPFSILEGSFMLDKFSQLAPKGSIHLAIVDPEVGSKRRGIIIETRDFYFVDPDNGLLFPAAKSNGIEKVYLIDAEKINTSSSNTFHGRDLFAKVAAFLSVGKNPRKFSFPIRQIDLTQLEFQKNQVLHIDSYGNIKINSNGSECKTGDTLRVSCNDWSFKIPFAKTFSDVAAGKLLVYRGSNNTLEIAKNLGSANNELNLKIGDIIKITKENKND